MGAWTLLSAAVLVAAVAAPEFLVFLPVHAEATGDGAVVLGSYAQRKLSLKPLDWTYLRLELPEWFSSINMTFSSDANFPSEKLDQFPHSEIAVICLKDGNPPIPDISDASIDKLLSSSFVNGFLGDAKNMSYGGHCVPFQRNISVLFTNEELSPGVWYIGYFNGLGPLRTQSKMISRGRTYIVSTSIIIEGCSLSATWGSNCNQSVSMIPCIRSEIYKDNSSRGLLDFSDDGSYFDDHAHQDNVGGKASPSHQLVVEETEQHTSSNSDVTSASEILMTCHDSNETLCLQRGSKKIYFMDISNMAVEFTVNVTNITSVQDIQANSSVVIMCYARYNGLPSEKLHDYSADLNLAPLTVELPRVGRWYISVEYSRPVPASFVDNLCLFLEWQATECLTGKAGTSCIWKSYNLQRIPKIGSTVTFESYYLPSDEVASTASSHFSLEPLLSNFSAEQVAWTYFLFDVPRGAASSLIHLQMKSDEDLNYELYMKFGGMPSESSWDYSVNGGNSTNSSASFSFRNTSMDLFIYYAKEGTWCVGLKHPSITRNSGTYISISLEGCHMNCNQKGSCQISVDESGLTFYSFCACDRDHGGFDCSIELVSPRGHMLQSIFLIASNAAAILPAFWALRRKAYAEWILFTSSGISSALYHACDVGTWCVLSFHVLQFLDFWLSFMAVISTFIFMVTIGEAAKRAILSAVFILTALLAATGATRSANIGIIVAVGSLGLLVCWLLEFSSARRFTCLSGGRSNFHISVRWQDSSHLVVKIVEVLNRRFRWLFVILGFVALSLAATSWKLESSRSYWIWHSLWHITIYTSSFFFLCSTIVDTRDEIAAQPSYELARQDSVRMYSAGA